MNAYSRLLCVGLVSTVGAGACLSDVEYLKRGRDTDEGGTSSRSGSAGSGDSTSGSESGGNGGLPAGGVGTAGKGGSAGTTSEAGMPAEGGSGGSEPVVPPCEGVVPIFEFDEANIVTNRSDAPARKWSKGPYGSTNTATGDLDVTADPPTNTTNLANLSRLEVSATKGEPSPSMSLTIPISPTVYKPQVVNVLYAFTTFGALSEAVNFSTGKLSARVKLDSAPHPNCNMKIFPWTTGTTTGSDFKAVDGGEFAISSSKWSTVTMDLSKSTPKTSVNQYGFVLTTTCTNQDPGEGGAGGVDAGGSGGSGGTGGGGGNGGSGGYTGPKTVVLFDSIETTCD